MAGVPATLLGASMVALHGLVTKVCGLTLTFVCMHSPTVVCMCVYSHAMHYTRSPAIHADLLYTQVYSPTYV